VKRVSGCGLHAAPCGCRHQRRRGTCCRSAARAADHCCRGQHEALARPARWLGHALNHLDPCAMDRSSSPRRWRWSRSRRGSSRWCRPGRRCFLRWPRLPPTRRRRPGPQPAALAAAAAQRHHQDQHQQQPSPWSRVRRSSSSSSSSRRTPLRPRFRRTMAIRTRPLDRPPAAAASPSPSLAPMLLVAGTGAGRPGRRLAARRCWAAAPTLPRCGGAGRIAAGACTAAGGPCRLPAGAGPLCSALRLTASARPAALQVSSATPAGDFYFFQAQTGQWYFLDPLNLRCLLQQYGAYAGGARLLACGCSGASAPCSRRAGAALWALDLASAPSFGQPCSPCVGPPRPSLRFEPCPCPAAGRRQPGAIVIAAPLPAFCARRLPRNRVRAHPGAGGRQPERRLAAPPQVPGAPAFDRWGAGARAGARARVPPVLKLTGGGAREAGLPAADADADAVPFHPHPQPPAPDPQHPNPQPPTPNLTPTIHTHPPLQATSSCARWSWATCCPRRRWRPSPRTWPPGTSGGGGGWRRGAGRPPGRPQPRAPPQPAGAAPAPPSCAACRCRPPAWLSGVRARLCGAAGGRRCAGRWQRGAAGGRTLL
jgi:hypothetical protein